MKLGEKIRKIIGEKKSNLCVSLDFTTTEKVLETIELVKESVVMVKIHVDIIEDFNQSFIDKLVRIAEENKIFILEDRKFADIGHIFKKQFTGGIYKIQSWCHLITVHSVVGSGPLQGFSECVSELGNQGVLLISQMSNSGNWLDDNYHRKTLELARNYPDVVCGFISQSKHLDDSFLQCTPGVNRLAKSDGLDQRYKTPSQAIEDGADIIIVGRGITGATDIKKEAEIYRELAWDKYTK